MIFTKHLSETPASPRFSLLVPTWNNLPYLRLFVDSLRKNSVLPVQIILHINDGSDGTLEWARQQPDLSWTHTPVNEGICKAVNLARTLARAEYLVYFNDDMYACPGWDTALWAQIESVGHPLFSLSGTMIEPLNTRNPCVVVRDFGQQIETFREADLLRELPGLVRNDWRGATWPPNVVHRDLWDIVGGLSIEFSPGMYSDPDFSRKLWAVGVRTFIGVGNSLVYHFGCKSTKRIRQNDGRRLFRRKWRMSARQFRKMREA